jgi:hypothetical protein
MWFTKLHHSMRHGCVYSIELTDKWHRVNLHGKVTRTMAGFDTSRTHEADERDGSL